MNMKLIASSLLAVCGLAPFTSALASVTPQTGITYAVGIPSSSTISSSSTGPLYFSLTAPTSYEWVGLGIGTDMSGATIFVMYADGTGNVTLSARDGGAGHVEPQWDSALQKGITLLEGSGIVGGNMVANVRCTTCKLDSASNSQSSPWIAAWNQGSAADSTDDSFSIPQHALTSTSQFTFDLTTATLSSDTNPFVSSSSSSTNTASGASPSSTPTSPDSSGSNSGSTIVTSGNAFVKLPTYEKAHGIIMSTVMVLLFPIGAVFMRVFGSPLIHGIIQVFSLCALIAGFGLGVKLGQMSDYLYKGPGLAHTVFGTVIVALFLIQPFLGLLHHSLYQKTGGRTSVSHIHIWFGRALMICGVVNGGLGLKLAANTHGGEIAYGAVAGVVAVGYTAIVLLKRKGDRSQVVVGSGSGRRTGTKGWGRKVDMQESSEQVSR